MEISKTHFKEPSAWTKFQKVDSTDEIHINMVSAVEKLAKIRTMSQVPDDLKAHISEDIQNNFPILLEEFKDERNKAITTK